MSPPKVSICRDDKDYFQSHFQPPIPWNPIQLKGNYKIQSLFYEITTTAIHVRVQTTEDTEALVLFPIHFGTKEYAYLFLTFKQYTLQHPDVLKDEAFDDFVLRV